MTPTHPFVESSLEISQKLTDKVLQPMKTTFIGKDEVIDLLGVSLVARENLFILGPPGTAKSALVQDLSRRIDGQVFDYLLTRFTEPNEILGPFDIRQLREGNLVTNTEGMLPEATFVFLDELLNANSAILNSLLMVLNERVFRRGRETRSLPTLLVVGASNSLPKDDALRALFDRFLLRINSTNVDEDSMSELLRKGWQMEHLSAGPPAITVDEVVSLQSLVAQVSLNSVLPTYIHTVKRLRAAGIEISDRRAVKLQRMLAASAILCGRMEADFSDLWVLRYIWDTFEQQEILSALIRKAIESASQAAETGTLTATHRRHPQSQVLNLPNAEALGRDLMELETRVNSVNLSDAELTQIKDQLTILASQISWVNNEHQANFLQSKVQDIWNRIEAAV
ncbi:MAG TPA: AAA family ATPase [Pirellulaceae bacterium]|nr:AAA family ATPase [Pirellulaceae bacterium]HMO93162.1 AAA family ATPase [Pirellulaceae bacterium]HMP70009.1 AAA family ATPase [Pirellulaceae bacterium]